MASKVTVIVGLTSGAVSTGLIKIKAQFSQLRRDLSSSLGSFVAFGSIVAGVRSLIDHASKLSDVSRQFGAPVRELQRVSNAGKDSGVELEDVARSWNKLTVNQQKAISGNEAARKSFKDLGIPMEEVARLTPDELFYRIADATASAEDRGKAYAAVYALMGRNAGVLFSTLQLGSVEIKRVGDEMGIMSDKSIEALDDIGDRLGRLKITLFQYGGEILIFFSKLAESLGATAFFAFDQWRTAFTGIWAALKTNPFKGESAGKELMETLRQLKTGYTDFAATMKLTWVASEPPKEQTDKVKKKAKFDVEDTEAEIATTKRIVGLKEKLVEMERKAANEQLSLAERLLALTKQRAELLARAKDEKDAEKKLQFEIDAAEIAKEIVAAQEEMRRIVEETERLKLQEREAAARDQTTAPKISSNAMRRIGGQETGGFAVSGIDEKMLREQAKHTKLLEKIERNTEKAGSGPLVMK